MLVTLLGIVMLVSPEQPSNAPQPMLVTLSGIVMLVKPLQPEKALPPMLVPLVISTANELGLAFFATMLTLSAEPDMFAKPVQLENALLLPILVTLSGIVILFKPLQL